MANEKPAPTLVDIDELRVWGVDTAGANPNEGDIGAIALSIKRYGFNRLPSVWKDKEVRAGNHGVLALRMLKTQGELPPKRVIEKEGKWYVPFIDVSELSATEALGFAIADNHLAQLASQDETLLAQYLKVILEDDKTVFEATGYDEEDLNDIYQHLAPPDLEQLREKYGDPDDTAFWPVIRVQVNPVVYQRYQELLTLAPGSDEADKLAIILQAVDESIFSTIVP